jgi:hypothetical protein
MSLDPATSAQTPYERDCPAEEAGRKAWLDAVRRDLEPLRQQALERENPRQWLLEAAPCIDEALREGVPKETVLPVLATHGYRGTRSMFLYFVKHRLKQELLRQDVTPEGWVREKPAPRPGDGAGEELKTVSKREPRRSKAAGIGDPRGLRERLAGPCGRSQAPGTVFKAVAPKQENEFERRLAEASRQRKACGEWQAV